MSEGAGAMLDVYSGGRFAGRLRKSSPFTYSYTYDPSAGPQDAVSMLMPTRIESIMCSGQLHPVFQMNLPEGALRSWLETAFQKVLPDFDDLTLLSITGPSQIGRLGYAQPGSKPAAHLPALSIDEVLENGSQDLFAYLLEKYAKASGISGVQPKVLVRSDTPMKLSPDHKPLVVGTTHIVKAWDNKFPHLALNEYYCMAAAEAVGLEVPTISLSTDYRLLVVERFDISENGYLGMEDLCSLEGLGARQKYKGSYEQLVKRTLEMVSPELASESARTLFKMIALSVVLRNGDAHRKNFSVLYENPVSGVCRLAPTYDIVSTTPYIEKDTMALLMHGTKRWPDRKGLVSFGRSHCNLSEEEVKHLLDVIAHGVTDVLVELRSDPADLPGAQEIKARMVKAWEAGLHSLDEPL